MFDYQVTCNVIGIPRQKLDIYFAAARSWNLTGEQPSIVDDNFITWKETDVIRCENSPWFEPSSLSLSSRRGIAVIGSYRDLDLVASISSFSSVSYALELHLIAHVVEHGGVDINQVRSFSTDLSGLYKLWSGRLHNKPKFGLTFVDGQNQTDGRLTTISGGGPNKPVPYDESLKVLSLGVEIEGTEAIIFGNTSVTIEAPARIGSQPNDVPDTLTCLSKLMKDHITDVTHDHEIEEDVTTVELKEDQSFDDLIDREQQSKDLSEREEL